MLPGTLALVLLVQVHARHLHQPAALRMLLHPALLALVLLPVEAHAQHLRQPAALYMQLQSVLLVLLLVLWWCWFFNGWSRFSPPTPPPSPTKIITKSIFTEYRGEGGRYRVLL